jgi:hypothetical protein
MLDAKEVLYREDFIDAVAGKLAHDYDCTPTDNGLVLSVRSPQTGVTYDLACLAVRFPVPEPEIPYRSTVLRSLRGLRDLQLEEQSNV